MSGFQPKNLNQKTTWFSFLSLLLFVFAGVATIGPLLGFVLALPFVGFDLEEIKTLMSFPTNVPHLRTALIVFQGGNAIGYSIVAPLLYFRYVRKQRVLDYLGEKDKVSSSGLTLSFSLALISIFWMSPIAAWNEDVNFHSYLPEVYDWMRGQEDKIQEVTRFMTNFQSFPQFLIALFVIAAVAAVGEEFLFRGIIQNQLTNLTKNHHVGIFLSAFIFSAIHFQFFGFFPRFILGLSFGYMYHFGRSLVYPIAAHFFNNAFVVVSIYFYKNGFSSLDPNSDENAPLWLSGLALIAFVICFFSYIKIFENTKKR